MKKNIEYALDTLLEWLDILGRLDFGVPTEPKADASADAWREYGLEVAEKLADAEAAVDNAIRRLGQ